MRAGGEMGENFLLAKISSYMVICKCSKYMCVNALTECAHIAYASRAQHVHNLYTVLCLQHQWLNMIQLAMITFWPSQEIVNPLFISQSQLHDQ